MLTMRPVSTRHSFENVQMNNEPVKCEVHERIERESFIVPVCLRRRRFGSYLSFRSLEESYYILSSRELCEQSDDLLTLNSVKNDELSLLVPR